jgi:hypothetical protein
MMTTVITLMIYGCRLIHLLNNEKQETISETSISKRNIWLFCFNKSKSFPEVVYIEKTWRRVGESCE